MGILNLFLSLSLSWASLPPSTLNVPAGLKDNPWDNGYSKQRYELVLKHLKSIYGPIVQEKGGVLKIKSDWEDGAVNMWADRIGDDYWLEVPGGMSRYHLITEEGFITSLCHELGHLLGGEPLSGKISFEGQSDYWAGQNCVQLVLESLLPEKSVLADTEIESACGTDNVCQRVLSGMKSLTSLYAELESSTAPQFRTPSPIVVNETIRSHPPAQCRLDTFLAGYRKLARPVCWYKP